MIGGEPRAWIVQKPTPYPACAVLRDPNTDQKCGAPAVSGLTALDCAVCDECYDAVFGA